MHFCFKKVFKNFSRFLLNFPSNYKNINLRIKKKIISKQNEKGKKKI